MFALLGLGLMLAVVTVLMLAVVADHRRYRTRNLRFYAEYDQRERVR